MHVIIKVGLATVVPAALATAFFFLSSQVEGHDAALLFRLGIFSAILGALLGILVWLIHNLCSNRKRIVRLELTIKYMKESHKAEAGRIRKEIKQLREELELALFMKEHMNDNVIRTLFLEEN
jgi:hypothetical protein